MKVGSLAIHLSQRRVVRDGRDVDVSRKEFEVLAVLARHRDRALSRDEIHDLAWGRFDAGATRTVDYHILNLRRKLEANPKSPRVILTRHGFGYQLGE